MAFALLVPGFTFRPFVQCVTRVGYFFCWCHVASVGCAVRIASNYLVYSVPNPMQFPKAQTLAILGNNKIVHLHEQVSPICLIDYLPRLIDCS